MSVIDEYLAKLPADQRAELERVKNIAQTIVPDAEETMSYGLPTLKYKGKGVFYFGAFRDHMSVFPGSALTESVAKRLSGYKVQKGTIQFTLDKPLPDDIIIDLVRARKAAIDQK